jgi:polysaccharide export outer membrane protein
MTSKTKYRLPVLATATFAAAMLALVAAAPRDHAVSVESPSAPAPQEIQLCQALSPAAPYNIWSVDSAAGDGCSEVGWDSRGCSNWQTYAQGEYVGHARLPHVSEYRLRVGDQLAMYYLRTREVLSHPYELQVGDVIRVESLTAGGGVPSPGTSDSATGTDDLSRQVIIQPDGTITLPLLGQVRAAGHSIPTLRDELEEKYKRYYRVPAITVTAVRVDTRLEDLMETVDARGGVLGGRQLQVNVTPAGQINLPAIGSVYVQGLSISEAKMEIDARYHQVIPGVQVTPDLTQRAQRFVYVLGQVQTPGQFELQGPTTTMQAIARAGGWKVGANMRQIVVFRRGDDWRLLATMVDLRGALYARRPVPADEIWLNDSDIILVPKNAIQMADEVIEQVFTRGVYAAVPIEMIWGQGFGTVSTIITQ